MLMAALLLALVVQDDPGTVRLEADKPVLVRGVPFTLTVRTDPRFSGRVQVRGLRDMSHLQVANGVGTARVVPEDEVEAVTPRGGAFRLDVGFRPGWLSLVPGIVAIGLALLTRQILVALFAGAWTGMLILGGFTTLAPVTAAVRTLDTLLLDVLGQRSNLTILVFVVLLGGLIGLLVHSGGTRGIADRFGRRMARPKAAMLMTWALGVVVFIQDYASALLVGNTMRPFTDKVRISREKLAYLIDSTVAPIAVIGVFSVWTAADLGGWSAFIGSVPYSFYALLALMLGVLVAASERDFGPMLAAERRASNTGLLAAIGSRPLADRDSESDEVENMRDRWTNVAIPLAGVVAIAVAAQFATGSSGVGRSVLWGILGGTVLALGTVLARRHLDLRQSVDAWVRGARTVFFPVCVVAMAWCLALTARQLSMGEWIWSLLGGLGSAAWILPSLFFVAAAVAAAASGSSIATAAALLPALPDDGSGLRPAAIAAILSGAVFGRHVYPLGDTTIFASLGAASDHADHVRTQAPYAALCAGAALLCGFVPAGFGVSPFLSLIVGGGVVAGVFFALARFRAEPTEWAAPASIDMPTQIPLPEEQTMS